jgi:outer membrane protein assembly factor BamC
MKIVQVGICSVVLVSFVGCSAVGLGNKRIDYGAGAVQVPVLEVPPDLTAPEADDRYKVAGADAGSVATYSAYTKGEAIATPTRSAVLPAVKGVSLEHNGTQRWLKVDDKAENVWPVVISFLRETGLKVESEDQGAGVIQTEWQENRANIPQGAIRNVLGKVFDGLYSSNERDQYRIRLERSKDGASTEIYITQYGKEEIFSADQNTSKWQSRPNDPELEAELLQRLMVRFGGTPVQAAVEAGDAGAVSMSNGSASLVKVFDGSNVIVINDAFDKSWRRVGLAIERAGYVVEDKDRTRGVYFLRTVKVEKGWMDKLEFWKSDEDADLRYRVNVKDGGASCEVSVTDQNGAHGDATRERIDAIYKNINQ